MSVRQATTAVRAAAGNARLAAAALTLLPALASAAEGALSPAARAGRLLAGLLVVIALLLLAARWLPRLGRFAGVGTDSLRIVASLHVGQRERLMIVQVGERQLLVGVAPGRVDTLHVLEQPIAAADRTRRHALDEPAAGGWLARFGRQPQ